MIEFRERLLKKSRSLRTFSPEPFLPDLKLSRRRNLKASLALTGRKTHE